MADIRAHPESGVTAPRHVPAGYRMGSGASASAQTSGDLEEQLRIRLRVMLLIWGSVAAALGVTAIILHLGEIRPRPSLLFTQPPLPGVLLLVTLGTSALIWTLAPGRQIGLRRLRAIEWIGVALTAGFFGFNQTLSLHLGTAWDIRENSMDLAAGLGAPWGALAVGFGVLIPSKRATLRGTHSSPGSVRVHPRATHHPWDDRSLGGAPVYLAVKAVTVGAMSALAIYGAYRIDVLRQDAQEARQLGQYVLRRRLGEGGMGEVYLAEHQFLRRSCAVKLIRPEQAGNEETLARFEREVRAAARLTHPNTIQIYDYGRAEDGTFYYAMEYLPGVTLQDLVDSHGPMPPARAVRVLSQLCGALREAHACGLVHRDIKPGNVMLGERGGVHDVAKLLDYGLVAAVRSSEVDSKLTQTGMIVGTPAFMSPEQCAGDAEVTGASDIYSLGALAYCLLTGSAPFAGRSTIQMMAAHLYETPKPLTARRDDVPPTLSSVIDRCLAKSPEGRFPDMETLEQALLGSVRTDEWTEGDARDWWLMRQGPALAGTPLAASPVPPASTTIAQHRGEPGRN